MITSPRWRTLLAIRFPAWRFSPLPFAVALMVLATLFGLTGCSKPPAEPGWVAFSSATGKFTAMMPSKPEETINKTPTGEETHTFSLTLALSNIRAISVGYVEQPAAVQGNSDRVLNAAKDQAVKGLDGRLLREKPVTLGSFPGKEIEFALPKGNVVVQRIFLAHNRQYTAMVITSASKTTSPEVDRFFNSFKIDP